MPEKFKLRTFASISGLCLGNISQATMSTTNVRDTKGNAVLRRLGENICRGNACGIGGELATLRAVKESDSAGPAEPWR